MSVLSGITSEALIEQFQDHVDQGVKAEEEDPDVAAYHYLQAAKIARRLDELKPDSGIADWGKLSDGYREKGIGLMQSQRQTSEDFIEDSGSSTEEVSSASGDFFQSSPSVSFDDVGGHGEIKSVLREQVIDQFEDSGFREELGAYPTNGVIMFGPPGTGKSLLSKAVAGELGVNYAEVRASQLSSKWVGEAPKNVKKLFQEARDNEPCVIFLDEIDGLARSRDQGNKSDSEFQRVSEFLQEMQDIQGRDILVIAATNLLDDVDDAVVRSGRFDEKIEVPLPDREGRRKIFEVHLEDRAVDRDSINWGKLLEVTQGFSGADLEAVVTAAARKANIESNEKDRLQPLSYRHLVEAVSEIDPSTEFWSGTASRGGR